VRPVEERRGPSGHSQSDTPILDALPVPTGHSEFAPGERITEPLVEYLKTESAEGICAEGCVDQSLTGARVVA
jgi:arginine/lysine/ornithine decarboxylase